MTDLAAPISLTAAPLPPAVGALSSLHTALQPIALDMLAVDRTIRTRLTSDVALINTIADYIVA
ncbi:MAG: hypothetical protein H0V63_05685, partial [Burkholderiaceae bacterium]|nr:hypothetical protein [Burkholderiaceae bacterium]